MRKKRPNPNEPRVHLKIAERNGIVVVLCNKASEMVWKVTDDITKISCKHCLSRIDDDYNQELIAKMRDAVADTRKLIDSGRDKNA